MFSVFHLNIGYPEILLFLVTFLIVFIITKNLEYRKLPPGPYGFPIVGYLPFLTNKPHKIFMDLEQKYGKIFCINIFFNSCIIINDWKIAQKILKHPATFARPHNFTQLMPGKGGFVSDSGDEWVKGRRFSVEAMKILGIGRGQWETLIQEEVIEFIKKIMAWEGKANDFTQTLEHSWGNIIIKLFFGKRLSYEENSEYSKIIMNYVNTITSYTASSFEANAPMPILKAFRKLGIKKNLGYLFTSMEDYQALITNEINRMLKLPDLNPTTLMDIYVQEIKKQNYTDNGDLKRKVTQVVGDLTSLYIGAYDTTKASLNWLFLIITCHPEVQEKVHQEIDDVFGNQRLIYWEDRIYLPYVMATINEALRWIATLPLFPPRRALDAFEFENYIIPKGSTILTNSWRIMRDTDHHANPDDFKPERFLHSKEKKQEGYLPFSIGKRNCPGEQVAMISIFLYFTAVMQKFRLIFPDGNSFDKLHDLPGIVRHPRGQEICFVER